MKQKRKFFWILIIKKYWNADPVTTTTTLGAYNVKTGQTDANFFKNQPAELASTNVYNAYNRDYLTTFGAVAYNREFKKIYLEGSNNLCELVPLASKKGSKFLHLTTQANMVYGYGDGLADEKATVEKFHEFLLSYVATMFFG